MKRRIVELTGVLVLILFVLGSCKKWIDSGINKVPYSPDDVPMYALLASIESNMAYNTVGGTDVCMPTCIWIQQLHGIAHKAASEGIYNLSDDDVNNQWNTNYSRTMIDLYVLKQKALAAKHPYYLGIAEVLMAYSLGISTDMWNEIPYSEAFLGSANPTPKFDSQEEIYNSIKSMLDDAINNQLIQDTSDIPKQDLIYNGDMNLWLRAAHALRARYALHLSKQKPGTTAYSNALADIPDAFSSNNEDMAVVFSGHSGAQNPFYQFLNQGVDVAMDSVFIENLTSRFGRSDPRISVYATKNVDGKYVGAGWNWHGEDVSLPGPAFAAADAPVLFITYAECLLIKAECEFATGVSESLVQNDLVSAVTASMEKWGVFSPAYMAAYDSVVKTMSGPALFREIIYQKYIAMIYQVESYNDWRRTENVIGLKPNPDGVLPSIPRRFPYPTDEKNYNPKVPKPFPTISDRVWWDKLINP
jgi:hypothetical protein